MELGRREISCIAAKLRQAAKRDTLRYRGAVTAWPLSSSPAYFPEIARYIGNVKDH
jgi:hypothetical protein